MEPQVPAPEPAPDLPIPAPAPEAEKENRFWEHSSGRPKGEISIKTQITHDALIDHMLANPRATRKEVAEAFGWKSEATISIIMNSDAFQAAYAKRRCEVVNPLLNATLEARMKGLAAQSAANLAEALEREPQNVKLNLEVFKESAKAASYGAKAQVAVQTQFVVHMPGPAASSTEWRERFAPSEAPVLLPRTDDAPSEGQ